MDSRLTWRKKDLNTLNSKKLSHLLAFGFGVGLTPKMPGTAATLATIPLYLLLQPLSSTLYISMVIAFFLIGIWICGKTSQDLGVPDHSGIVWDEVVGFLIALIAQPTGFIAIFLAFVLFRAFDIWKPWPISWVDKNIHGGLGIMLDDVLAGLLTALVLQLFQTTIQF